jgi:hypothetical protein
MTCIRTILLHMPHKTFFNVQYAVNLRYGLKLLPIGGILRHLR